MSKPRVCLIADVRGWAFDRNFHDIEDYLSEEFDFTYHYLADQKPIPDWKLFDVIFEPYHRNPPMRIPYHHALGALAGQWFDPGKRVPPTSEDFAVVNRYRGFQCMSKRNFDEVKARCPKAVYLTNPVNMRRFTMASSEHKTVIAEWNGNASPGYPIKHFHDVIVPACAAAGVHLNVAEYSAKEGPWRRRAPDEMPAFYRESSVALCASEFEGCSNSVMEAMAAGLAVVATDVGNHREMQESQIKAFGSSGIILVERSVEAFAEALRALSPSRVFAMGALNRSEIIARWSWDSWTERYAKFFRMAL